MMFCCTRQAPASTPSVVLLTGTNAANLVPYLRKGGRAGMVHLEISDRNIDGLGIAAVALAESGSKVVLSVPSARSALVPSALLALHMNGLPFEHVPLALPPKAPAGGALAGTNVLCSPQTTEKNTTCSTGLTAKDAKTGFCTCQGDHTCALNGVCLDLDTPKLAASLDWEADMAKDLMELSGIVYKAKYDPKDPDGSEQAVQKVFETGDWEKVKKGKITKKKEYYLKNEWHCIQLFENANHTQFLAAICPTKKAFAIIFRGSASFFSEGGWKDWWTDLSMYTTTDTSICPEGKLQAGFAANLKAIESQLDGLMSQFSTGYAPKGWKLYLSGHSLGGALAQLATMYIVNKYNSLKGAIRTYTFAGPRVADATAAAWINGQVRNIFMICEDGDPVPTTSSLGAGWGQVGTFITRKGADAKSSRWYLNVAPNYDGLTAIFKTHSPGEADPAECKQTKQYRCDVPSLPADIDDMLLMPPVGIVGPAGTISSKNPGPCSAFPNSGGLKTPKGVVCVCNDGFAANNGACITIPTGFDQSELVARQAGSSGFGAAGQRQRSGAVQRVAPKPRGSVKA